MTALLIIALLILLVVVIAKWAIATHDLHEAARFSGERKVWNTDPDVQVPHFSVEKSGREEREKASGIVIDPGGTCLCRRCGHTVSVLYDHCDNCNAIIDWNA